MARGRFLVISPSLLGLGLLLACSPYTQGSGENDQPSCTKLLCFDPVEPVEVGPGARDLELVDCDEDGHLDIIVANSGAATISVSRGTGDGAFEPQETYDAGPKPRSLATADFDGDGNMDLAVANSGSGASVLFGDGGCGFGDGVLVFGDDPLGEGSSGAQAVAGGDIDGDGNDDVVAQISDGDTAYLAVFPGAGDGSFGDAQTETVGTVIGDLHAIDLDQDGALDLAGITGQAEGDDAYLHVLHALSNGTFHPAQDHTVTDGPETMAMADFNEDGLLDVVTAGGQPGQGTVSMLRGIGDADFSGHVTFPLGEVDANGTAAADMDDDGNMDVVVALGNSNEIAVLRGRWDGTLVDPLTFATDDAPSSGSDTPDHVALADVNEDGLPDILATNRTGPISVLLSVP